MGVGANNQKAQKPLEEVTLNMADCPNPENNFKDWLKYQKSNWRRIRKDLKAEKQLVTKGPSGLGKMRPKLVDETPELVPLLDRPQVCRPQQPCYVVL